MPLTPKERVSEIVIKVQPTGKTRKKTDFTESYTANIYIPYARAMNEYLLESSELDSLPKFIRRSPYPERDNITVFRRRDVELCAIGKWGKLENIQLEKEQRKAYEKESHAGLFPLRYAQKQYRQEHADGTQEKPYIFTPPSPPPTVDISADGKGPAASKASLFQHGSGRVVLYAIAINTANCLLKFAAWLFTGSHSMFSEFIHSLADTANQLILAAGIRQSLKQADTEHPYGWATFRNVSSLISGFGIFCVGAGLSYYHGIMGFIDPSTPTDSYFWALAILGGSFISEGATLLVAMNEIRQSCKVAKMPFLQYVFTGRDPSTNVVLLEDLGAVIGVSIAATCISLTHYTGNPLPDAIGSLLIGTLLGGVASFIIYTNTMTLVGRSIPIEKKQEMMRELESDRMIRTLHDVKATDIGGRFVRFKAEVDFDGREITRYYLEQQVDLEKALQEMQSMTTLEDAESFLLKHGESIIDTLGGEVDRIEKNLKKKHPEIRHCDLEQL
jgi:zinc transporter 9